MYIFSFFETELDWIVCGDCGMWHSRELKKKEKYKNKKQESKKMEENQRGMQCNLFFFYLAKLPKAVFVLR